MMKTVLMMLTSTHRLEVKALWIDLNERHLDEQLSALDCGVRFVYFHTPLCGTCQLGHRMLSIVMEALPGTDIIACNLNEMPQRAQDWQIESVPCLAIVRDGRPIQKIYALQSVDTMYRIIRDAAGWNRAMP